ncbi:MAG: hypothetical protein RL515_1356 [Verrucomicrobiota bacterium]
MWPAAWEPSFGFQASPGVIGSKATAKASSTRWVMTCRRGVSRLILKWA